MGSFWQQPSKGPTWKKGLILIKNIPSRNASLFITSGEDSILLPLYWEIFVAKKDFSINCFLTWALTQEHEKLITNYNKYSWYLIRIRLGISIWKWVLASELGRNTDNMIWNKKLFRAYNRAFTKNDKAGLERNRFYFCQ